MMPHGDELFAKFNFPRLAPFGAINTYIMHYGLRPFYHPVYVFYGQRDVCLDFSGEGYLPGCFVRPLLALCWSDV